MSDYLQKQVDTLIAGSNYPSISSKDVRSLELKLPPLGDQQSIADSLEDAEAKVRQLDKLIAKKRDILSATSYELLSGNSRLGPISSHWRTVQLGTVASFSKGKGLSKNQLSTSGRNSCLIYGELFTTYGRVITNVVSHTDSSEGEPSRYGDVLIPGSTTTKGSDLATASALLLDDVQLSGDVNIIRPDLKILNPSYLAYHLTSEQRDSIAMRTQGITIYHLYGRHLADLEIKIPDLAEQIEIVEVLTDLQLGIDSLESQRDKAEMIKQGMMEVLLSGKVRIA